MAAIAEDYEVGYGGIVTADGVEQEIQSWSCDFMVGVVNNTHGKAGGFAVKSRGVRSASGQFVRVLKITDASTLQEGVKIPLKLKRTSGKYNNFPIALVTKITESLTVEGEVRETISFESSGTFDRNHAADVVTP